VRRWLDLDSRRPTLGQKANAIDRVDAGARDFDR